MDELIGFGDGDPIATWPPFFGAISMFEYDPSGTGLEPLYELAGPNPGGPNVNLANGSAFSYGPVPYPIEVFMVAFHQLAALGTSRGTILSSSNVGTFDTYIDTPTNLIHMNLGVNSTLNLNMVPFYGVWTTLSIAMAGASSHVNVDGTAGVLAPANPGANLPGPLLSIGDPIDFVLGDVGVNSWGGSVAEICVFNCVLTDAQRASLRAYFQNKFILI